jgi:hypothetical protein
LVDPKLHCDFLAIALFDCILFSHAMPDATSSCSANPKVAPTSAQTKRPPGNVGDLFFQGRIVPTEGVSSVKTFWRNLMSLKSGVSSDFWELNMFIFNNIQTALTSGPTAPKWSNSAFPAS